MIRYPDGSAVCRGDGIRIGYGLGRDGWFGFDRRLRALASRAGVRRVCEIGGGANPALPLDFVRRHALEYTVLDISADELAKAPAGYQTVLADIADPSLASPDGPFAGRFDLVVSHMVAEHVSDGERFHRNVFALLAPGGVAFHCFPTLYTLPFVVNRLMPTRLADALLHVVQGGRENHGHHGCFPAYYSWCHGPTRSQIDRLRSVGFEVLEYVGFYGHTYYRMVAPLHRLHEWLSRALVEHPLPQITTTCWLLMRRPLTAIGPRRCARRH